jgi:Phage portal protein, SPP1 Gp6-like
VALAQAQIVGTAAKLLTMRDEEQPRLEKIAAYMRGQQSSVYVPRGAKQEYRWLIRRAKVNILPLPITVMAQNLFVDGYRPEKSDQNAKAWASWQANRMDRGQHGLHRATLKYGISYTVVLPGRLADSTMPVITPKSPRRLTAFYEDAVEDEWPVYAVEIKVQNVAPGKRQRVVLLYDDQYRYRLTGSVDGPRLELDDGPNGVMEHGLGVCPVVRYLGGDDLDGDECVRGEVEPLFDLQDQLNMTTFNLMMAQHYAAFRQRYVSGMVATDENGNPKAPFQSRVDDLWVAEDADTKFGEFGQTDLSGYLDSRESTIRSLATISQTPPHNLLGQMANLSADALNSARDGLNSKVAEAKSVLGESHEQTMRLASLADGDEEGWRDTSAQAVWRDTEARSLSQTVDALGKLTQMLGVPPEELWEKIPGVSQQDVERWKAAAEKGDALGQLRGIVEKQMTPAALPASRPSQGQQLELTAAAAGNGRVG